MIKSIALSALMASLLAGAAFAQATPPAKEAPPAVAQTPAPQTPAPTTGATPDNADQCLKAASDLAQSAEDRKLAEEKLDKIEELLTKMETHCDAKQFVEAMTVAKDIKSLIETQ